MSQLFQEKEITTPTNDNEWAALFEKEASDNKFTTPAEMRQAINIEFNENPIVDKKLTIWFDKIAFDRNKLKQIFKK